MRIALLNIPDRPAPAPVIPASTRRGAFSLRKELEALRASCEGVDGLMFSDIQSARGRVEVYGVGEIFSSIPCGVRSYYAIPFFGPSGLHAVLILASAKAGAFGPDSDSRFRFLNAPFAGVIERWRRLKK